MKLKSLGENKTEITHIDGTVVLFSYGKPVAACLGDGGGFIRTARKWSRTTSRHITQWLAGANARKVSQWEMDTLAWVER